MQDLGDFYKEHRKTYSEEKIRSVARADALKNLPSADSSEPAPFEMELAHAYRLLASKVAGEHHSELLKLDAYIKSSAEHAEREHADEVKRVQSSREKQIAALEKDPVLAQANAAFHAADLRFQDMASRLGRLPISYMPQWLYVIFALLIFAGEIPLNALVFQVFGENQVMTWVMAVIIGLSVPLFAHFIGIKFREHGAGFSWPDALKGVAALSIILSALYGLSIMRTVYLGEFKDDLGITPNIVHSSIFFYFLNVAVLWAAIIVSYMAHDSIPGYQKIYSQYKRARKRLDKAERRHENALRACESEAIRLQSEADAAKCRGLDQVSLAKGQYDKVLREGKEHESRCLHRLGRDIAVYRRENLLNRQDGRTPSYFSEETDLALQLATVKEKGISEVLH